LFVAWAQQAFADFSAKETVAKETFLGAMAHAIQNMACSHDAGWIDHVVAACSACNFKDIAHPSIVLKSYHDVSVPAAALAVFVSALADAELWPGTSERELAKQIVEHTPSFRAGWLNLARLQLQAGEIDQAIQSSKQALALAGDCPTAQALLLQAYREKVQRDPSTVVSEIKLGSLQDRFCSKPFETMHTAESGHVFACSCGGWLPYSLGDLKSGQSVDEVWNGPKAVEIRRSIHDGDFSYCSRMLCPAILGDALPKKEEVADPLMRQYIDQRLTVLPQGPRDVTFSHDYTCNLACPSCRTELRSAPTPEQEQLADVRDRLLLPLLKRVDGSLTLCGMGDPFGSRHYRSILARLNPDEYPDLKIDLVTNGLLLTPEAWESFPGIHSMVRSISVSIDAATQETYEDLRRPGRWPVLLSNLEFMAGLRRSGQIDRLQINFVVQKKNFREMVDFVKLGQHLDCDTIMFMKLWNFEAFTPAEFLENDVCSPGHPEHGELLKILREPIFKSPEVSVFNIAALREGNRDGAAWTLARKVVRGAKTLLQIGKVLLRTKVGA
jgi:hypothetical protein